VKVLLDVNVLADLFLKREEWLTDAVAIGEANRPGRSQGCPLPSTIDTLASLVSRNRAVHRPDRAIASPIGPGGNAS